jgi:hypothetical protein
MEIWVMVTPGHGEEVWLVKLKKDGSLSSKFVLKSFSGGESPMKFAIDLAQWMNVKATTVIDAGDNYVMQMRYDPARGVT